jgi:hypothetical protein
MERHEMLVNYEGSFIFIIKHSIKPFEQSGLLGRNTVLLGK